MFPQCEPTCEVRNVAFEEQTKFFFKFGQRIYNSEDTQKSIQDNNGDVYCPERFRSRQKWVYVLTWKESVKSCYESL